MANNRIKIVQGNDLPLCKKLTTIIGGEIVPVPIEQMTDLKVLFGMGQQSKATEIPWTDGTDENHAIIHFRLESTQIAKLGTYNIWIVGKYGVNDVVVSYGSTIEVIEWSNKSTAGEFIYTEEQALDDSIFIPTSMSDEELERLKQLYAEKIEEAEQAISAAQQAKEEWQRKAAELDGVAQQGDNPNATNTAIYAKVQGIEPQPIPTDYAKEVTAQAIKTETDKIGTAADGQPATLFEAIAASGGGQTPTDYALGGTERSTSTNTDIKHILNTIATNMYKGVPVQMQSGNATIAPNVWNMWGEISAELTITKGTDITGIANEYIVRFTIASSYASPSIVFAGWQLVWNGGSVPTWTAGKTYEISIIDNIALWAEV